MRKLSDGWSEAHLKMLQSQTNNFLRIWKRRRLKKFLLTGFPNGKVENWKYTDITPIASQTFSFGEVVDCDISRFVMEDTYRIVFINGHFISRLSNLVQLPDEIRLMSLKAVLKDKKNMIGDMMSCQTPFSLLNDSLFQDGMFLHVPKNCHLEKPIHLLYLMKPNFQFTMTQTRHLIFIEENANVTLFEEYEGLCCNTYFNNIVTQINVGACANLSFYKLQGENDNSFHISNTEIRQSRNSQVLSCHVSLGGAISREDLNYFLEGHNASCHLLGFYYSKGRSHVDNHTRIDHAISGCVSQQTYKGIISDKSRAVFNGKILVRPEAEKTTAHQINKNLVFSKESEVDTKPELEIYNDDVNCTHGASVGQLNDEALFYFRSRGIDLSVAEHLLACAFASEIIEKLPNKLISERIHKRIIKCLALMNCAGDCHA